ncbi:MAG TPA: filamentous hemagglutinin N-terminal domain-containing protein [Rhodocyclaceae bacterium]|nr:filamentous hemagglutinin N-terminal domain-containing protein [Rhodocyclaceae bacterium]
MNKTYRLIWNETLNTWVAVAETVRSRGKRSSGTLLLAAALSAAALSAVLPAPTFAAPPAANQLPMGGQIVGGSGAIAQTSQRMIANWQSFDTGSQASVRFNQPSATSVALNRVLNQNPTQILGRLSANGHVMLVNPAGIVFDIGSQVDVGALTASTLAISDASFMAGRYQFAREAGALAGSINNQGRIVTPDGGVVALIAPVVQNEGSIETPKGSTLLAAGALIDNSGSR